MRTTKPPSATASAASLDERRAAHVEAGGGDEEVDDDEREAERGAGGAVDAAERDRRRARRRARRAARGGRGRGRFAALPRGLPAPARPRLALLLFFDPGLVVRRACGGTTPAMPSTRSTTVTRRAGARAGRRARPPNSREQHRDDGELERLGQASPKPCSGPAARPSVSTLRRSCPLGRHQRPRFAVRRPTTSDSRPEPVAGPPADGPPPPRL